MTAPADDLRAAHAALIPLVDAVRATQRRLEEVRNRPEDSALTWGDVGRAHFNEDRAVRLLADAAMALADLLAHADNAKPCDACGGMRQVLPTEVRVRTATTPSGQEPWPVTVRSKPCLKCDGEGRVRTYGVDRYYEPEPCSYCKGVRYVTNGHRPSANASNPCPHCRGTGRASATDTTSGTGRGEGE